MDRQGGDGHHYGRTFEQNNRVRARMLMIIVEFSPDLPPLGSQRVERGPFGPGTR